MHLLSDPAKKNSQFTEHRVILLSFKNMGLLKGFCDMILGDNMQRYSRLGNICQQKNTPCHYFQSLKLILAKAGESTEV